MQRTTTSFRRRVAADHAALSDARLALRRWLDAGPEADGAAITRFDVEVVVGELAANVIDHTHAALLHIEVTRHRDSFAVSVTNDGRRDGIPDVDQWATAPSGARGRGLRLIRALCSNISVDQDGGRTCITCTVPVSAALS